MIGKKIADCLELPAEAVSDVPLITVRGRDTVIVENYKRILGFSEEELRIMTGNGALCIKGDKLRLAFLKKDSVCIKGSLDTFFYE